MFLFATGLSWWLMSGYFLASLDEGIYTSIPQRLIAGERLYREIFTFIGPLLYWVETALYLLFGNDLTWLRIGSSLAIGAIATSAFRMGEQLGGRGAGWAAALVWIGIVVDLANRIEVNHRWLSSAFWMVGVAIWLTMRGPTSAFAAGMFVAAAAWTTPSFGIAISIMLVAVVVDHREELVWWLGGIMATSSPILVALGFAGTLPDLVTSLQWPISHYAAANRFPFGRTALAVGARYWLQIHLGTVCIPLSFVLCLVAAIRERSRNPIAIALLGAAFLATAYPKIDAYSLHYIAAYFWTVCVVMVWRLLPEPTRQPTQGLAMAAFVFLALMSMLRLGADTRIPTRAGVLHGSQDDAMVMEKLEATVPRGSTMLVYPYLSGLYTLLDVRNPSRYTFFQPGMMLADDEQAMLADLMARPPEFIFWQDFPITDFKRLWPNSNPEVHRFTRLEGWIESHYRRGIEVSSISIRGTVWKRR